jgi:hypothetical protein
MHARTAFRPLAQRRIRFAAEFKISASFKDTEFLFAEMKRGQPIAQEYDFVLSRKCTRS